jgi:ABC-type amino acid transport system permease subunit
VGRIVADLPAYGGRDPFSFPLGVLLALGRRSELPIIRLASVAYIELVRGVPIDHDLFYGAIDAAALFAAQLDG